MISSNLIYKLDMGWSKRSSGRRHDSQSGHSVLIGQLSKKMIDCVLCTNSCRIYTNAAGKSIESRQMSAQLTGPSLVNQWNAKALSTYVVRRQKKYIISKLVLQTCRHNYNINV